MRKSERINYQQFRTILCDNYKGLNTKVIVLLEAG